MIVTSLEASHERASYFYHTIRHEPKQEVINRQATFKLKASAVDTLCKLHPSGTGQASWVFVRQVLYDMFIFSLTINHSNSNLVLSWSWSGDPVHVFLSVVNISWFCISYGCCYFLVSGFQTVFIGLKGYSKLDYCHSPGFFDPVFLCFIAFWYSLFMFCYI